VNRFFHLIERVCAAFVVAFRLTLRQVSGEGGKVIVFANILFFAFVIGYAFHFVLEIGRGDLAPGWRSRIIGAFAIGGILIVGWVLFWLRENHRFSYGCLELSAAMATAYHAVVNLSTSQERMPGLLAYLGALYIAVRGYDNLQKAFEEYQRKNGPQSAITSPKSH
jgi:hypothetical protein